METTTLEPTKFVDAPSRTLAGVGRHFSFETMDQIPALWGRFGNEVAGTPGRLQHVSFGLSDDMGPNGFSYLAAVEIDDAESAPQALSVKTLPPSSYAVFTYRGHISKFNVLVDAVWHGWLPASGRTLADPPHMLERYDERFNPASEDSEMELWIPLKP